MKFKESLSAKIAAIIVSYVMAVVLVISVSATVVMGVYKFYFSEADTLKEEILTDMAQNEAYHISDLLDSNVNFERYYKDKNVFFKITYREDKGVITNYNSEPYIAYATDEYYLYDERIWIDDDGNEYFESVETKIADVEVYIARDMTKNDLFSAVAKIVDIGYSMRYAMVFIVLGSLAVLIFLLCFLYCAAGHRAGGVIKCNYLDMFPFDLLTAIVAVIAFFSVMIVGIYSSNTVSTVLLIAIIGSIDYFVALGYTMSLATRIKTRTLIKNNVIYCIFKFIAKYIKKIFNWLKYVFSNCSLLQKTWIMLLALITAELIFIIIIVDSWRYYGPSPFVFAIIALTVVGILVILYLAVVLQKIKLGGERIANGDLQYKIDTKFMFGDFKEFAESLNNINVGLKTAIDERMKSERFKTELITNVSHDIKTPLTSIINYVDLIKKEEIQNETVNTYIEVLDRQSLRLKKLVEDLVEASKASSGSLAVNFAPCDVCVLLLQTVGEFEEKMKKAGLTPVVNLPEKAINILADGRHLWRIFDNLMSNICKYAMAGTRVYLDVTEQENEVLITLRNVSKFQLNVSEEALMERFVRGDASRNTEGSGLGLSIARSLAELQNGKLELNIDADLFKVTLKFKKYTVT